jgi:hypothetical protein
MFCPLCHRLSCREFLALQRCSHCTLTVSPPRAPAQPTSNVGPREAVLHDAFVNPRFNVTVSRRREGSLEVISWTLPEPYLGARIHTIQHHDAATPDQESNDIFSAFQQPVLSRGRGMQKRLKASDLEGLWRGQLKLRRHELSMHRSCASGAKARLLTQMYTQNVGEQYKHSTATETVPLAAAPLCVAQAGKILTERTALVATLEKPFNELYPCAYEQGMKMSECYRHPLLSRAQANRITSDGSLRLSR